MQKTSKNKSTPKLAIHPHLKKARYSRIFKVKKIKNSGFIHENDSQSNLINSF